MAQKKSSKTSAKAPKKAMGKASKPARAAAPRKAKAAFGVEPITEGPYANSGPEGAARLAKGAAKPAGEVKAVITSPGSVTV